MIALYRFLVTVFCLALAVFAALADLGGPLVNLLALLGVAVLFMTLLLLAYLCASVGRLRDRDEGESWSVIGLGKEAGSTRPSNLGGILEIGRDRSREQGDRKFKADGTKVCKNCKYLDEANRICLRDRLSLEGVTIVAVGCQHWSLGLTVTEKDEPEGEGSDSPSDGAEKE